jgi:hypothetical protein
MGFSFGRMNSRELWIVEFPEKTISNQSHLSLSRKKPTELNDSVADFRYVAIS